jgi:sulfatase maturation enzyme AslB (radical SAM superfamily)
MFTPLAQPPLPGHCTVPASTAPAGATSHRFDSVGQHTIQASTFRNCLPTHRINACDVSQSKHSDAELIQGFSLGFKQNINAPCIEFIWNGGEPLALGTGYFAHALDICQLSNVTHKPIRHTLLTNGLLLDREWIALAKSRQIQFRPTIANGTLHSAVRAYEMLVNAGLYCDMACTLSTRNFAEATQIFNFFYALKVPRLHFSIGPDSPIHQHDLAATPTIDPTATYAHFIEAFIKQWELRGKPFEIVEPCAKQHISGTVNRIKRCYYQPNYVRHRARKVPLIATGLGALKLEV